MNTDPQTAAEADADTVASRAAQVITRMGADIRALTGERDRYRGAWRSARERAQAYGEGILRVVKDREQYQEWLRQAEERNAAAAPVAVPPADRAGLRDRIADGVVPLLLDTLPKVIARARGYEVADAVMALLFGPIPADTDTATWTAIRAIQLMNEAGQQRDASAEAHRLALSEALGLGTSAPWDAIRGRAAELAGSDGAGDRAAVLREGADELDAHAAQLVDTSDDPAAFVAKARARAAIEWRVAAALLRRLAEDATPVAASAATPNGTGAVVAASADRAAWWREAADECDEAGAAYTARALNDHAAGAFALMETFLRKTNEAEYVATPCDFAACESGGEPCSVHERLLAHAEGEHELCSPDCGTTAAETPGPETQGADIDPVYDPRAWETYRRDAGCGCTAPAPVDCKIPHGTGAWLCICHRLGGAPLLESDPRGAFLTPEEEAIRRHFQHPNRCLSVDGIFRCARPTGHLGDHRVGRTFWGRRAEDTPPAVVAEPGKEA